MHDDDVKVGLVDEVLRDGARESVFPPVLAVVRDDEHLRAAPLRTAPHRGRRWRGLLQPGLQPCDDAFIRVFRGSPNSL